MCSTMHIAAGRSAGNPLTTRGEDLDTAGRCTDHDQIAMAVELRGDSIPFHTDSVRSVRVPHQLSGCHPKGISAPAMSLERDGGLTGMKTDADSPRGADRDLR